MHPTGMHSCLKSHLKVTLNGFYADRKQKMHLLVTQCHNA